MTGGMGLTGVGSRRLTALAAASISALGVYLALGSVTAFAAVTSFGSYGEAAGQFVQPRGIAVEQENGDVYVVDRNNQRIEKWTGEGTFLLAWGWGVAGKSELQTCTTTCLRGENGSGAGQLREPEGIAVDNATLSMSHGDVFVLDKGNERVEKFGPNGEFILMFGNEVNETRDAEPGATEAQKDLCTQREIETSNVKCKAGVAGSGDGQFSGLGTHAVAVDAEGHVYVGDETRVQRFSEAGVYEETVLSGVGAIRAIAAAAGGEIYVVSSGRSGVREYEESSAEVGPARDATGEAESAIALDAGGDLFVDDESYDPTLDEKVHHILEYGSTGNEKASFDVGTELDAAWMGIAWGESTKVLYVLKQLEGTEVRLVSPPPPGSLVLAGSESAREIEPTTAQLRATLNPEGHDTEYRFEYGQCSTAATCANSPYPASTTTGKLAASFEDDAVGPVKIEALKPETTYHFRLSATDTEGHTTHGLEDTFTTLPPVSIDAEWVTEVTSSSADFGAEINPLGAAATWRIEYGPTNQYGAIAGSGVLSATFGDQRVTAEVEALRAATYHYRVVVEDEREGAKHTVRSEDHTFITQGLGGMLTLLDGRQWELASSPDKHGGKLVALGGREHYSVFQAASDGSSMTYGSVGATEAEPDGSSGYVQVLSRRSASGWSSADIGTSHSESTGATGEESEYRLFSRDLSFAFVDPYGPFTAMEHCSAEGQCTSDVFPPANEKTVYMRRNLTCESEPKTCYEPLVSTADTPSATKFGGDVQFVYATPDGHHVVLESATSLTKNEFELGQTPGPSQEPLYEWSATRPYGESLSLISILPEGGKGVSNVHLGSRSQGVNYRNAISANGSRVVWTWEKATQQEALYLRDTGTTTPETVRLDEPQPGAPPAAAEPHEEPYFETTSADGSMIFFTDVRPLTAESGSGKGTGTDLYVCNILVVGGKDRCDLTDLTPSVGQVQHLGARRGDEGVPNLIPGASENGEYVYFVATWVLTEEANARGETPVAEAPNLYMRHYDVANGEWEKPHLIATLSGEDQTDWAGTNGAPTTESEHLTARVSPDGRWLTFMSAQPLTGYDNTDASSRPSEARHDQEVYSYHAPARADEAGTLRCVSCNPSGARPSGKEAAGAFEELIGNPLEEGTWFAAVVPGYTQYTAHNATLYQPRYLSNDGRVFFDSPDALVSQDVNHTEDVYEWEPPSVGTCTTGSSTYSEQDGGCLNLISSGESAQESAFLDASESGNDVFFETRSKLVRKDYDTAYDVYDAHVCTSEAPCLPEPTEPQPCTEAESCREAPRSQPLVFGPPSTATFAGTGDVKPVKRTPKKLTHKQRLERALKRCDARYKHNRGKRNQCKLSARERPGARRSKRGHRHGEVAKNRGRR